jgi:hypothetical protein
VKVKDAGRMLVIAVLLTAAAGACGDGSGDGAARGGAAGTGGQGESNGRGQNSRAAVEVLPTSSFDPGPNGGADLPEPTLLIIEECYSALQARSFDVLAPRMTAVIQSAGPGTDRGMIVAAQLCRGLAHLNDGALAEAARDLDTAEGGLGALPGIPSTSWRCCCCAARWSPTPGSSGWTRPTSGSATTLPATSTSIG